MSAPAADVRLVLAALLAVLALPASASAHAYLVRTVPAASVVLSAPPPTIQLTYDEAVEPRFAIISVTNVDAQQETTGPVEPLTGQPRHARRAAARRAARGLVPHLLAGDLGRRPSGAGGVHVRDRSEPGPGARSSRCRASPPAPPAPQLLITRWLVFVTTMAAIGLLALRLVRRPPARPARFPEVSLRRSSVAFVDRVGARADLRSRSTSTSRSPTTRCARCSTSARSCRSTG